MKHIDSALGYSGHWQNGMLYISLRAESSGRLSVGRAGRFDDPSIAARWLLMQVGAEGAPNARTVAGRLLEMVRAPNWTLRAVDLVRMAHAP